VLALNSLHAPIVVIDVLMQNLLRMRLTIHQKRLQRVNGIGKTGLILAIRSIAQGKPGIKGV